LVVVYNHGQLLHSKKAKNWHQPIVDKLRICHEMGIVHSPAINHKIYKNSNYTKELLNKDMPAHNVALAIVINPEMGSRLTSGKRRGFIKKLLDKDMLVPYVAWATFIRNETWMSMLLEIIEGPPGLAT